MLEALNLLAKDHVSAARLGKQEYSWMDRGHPPVLPRTEQSLRVELARAPHIWVNLLRVILDIGYASSKKGIVGKIKPDKTFKNELKKIPLLHFHVAYLPINGLERFLNNLPLDVKDKYGNTALHYIKQYTELDVVKALVKKGANVHAQNDHGLTPLWYAVNCNNAEVANYLITGAGAKENHLLPSTHANIMHLAVYKGYFEIVELLLWSPNNKGFMFSMAQPSGHFAYTLAYHRRNKPEGKKIYDRLVARYKAYWGRGKEQEERIKEFEISAIQKRKLYGEKAEAELFPPEDFAILY